MKYFECLNDSKRVVLDDESLRIKLSRIIKINDFVPIISSDMRNVTWNGIYLFNVYEIPLNEDEFFVAIRAEVTSDIITISTRLKSNNGHKYVETLVACKNSLSPDYSGIRLEIYGQKGADASGYGIQIYNSNGSELYNSNQRLLNVIQDAHLQITQRHEKKLIISDTEYGVIANNLPCYACDRLGGSASNLWFAWWGCSWQKDGIYLENAPSQFLASFKGVSGDKALWPYYTLPRNDLAYLLLIK